MSGRFELAPETVTPGQLYMLLQSIDERQAQLVREQVHIRERMDRLENDTADLLAAWRAGGAVLRIVKWAAAVGAGLAAIWAFFQSRI